MCHISTASKDVAGQLDDCIEDNQNRGPDRNESKHKDHRIGVENGKHQQHPVDCPRSTNQNHIGAGQIVADEAYDSAEQTGEQIEEQKLLAADALLHHGTENEEAEHIEEQVAEAPVDKHVGERLPKISTQDERRDHGKVVRASRIEKCRQGVDQNIDQDQLEGKILIRCISESPIEKIGRFHVDTIVSAQEFVNCAKNAQK